MEKTNDTIHDTIYIYIEKDIKSIDDSTLVEEVFHRYDTVYQDIKSHDHVPAIVSILAIVGIVISILNRRRKNKENGKEIH